MEVLRLHFISTIWHIGSFRFYNIARCLGVPALIPIPFLFPSKSNLRLAVLFLHHKRREHSSLMDSHMLVIYVSFLFLSHHDYSANFVQNSRVYGGEDSKRAEQSKIERVEVKFLGL